MKQQYKRTLISAAAAVMLLATQTLAPAAAGVPAGGVTGGQVVTVNLSAGGNTSFDRQNLTFAAIPQWKQDLINAQPLNPRQTGHTELDAEVEAKLSGILTEGMSSFQKLRAVYDYITVNCVYSIPGYGLRYNGLSPNLNSPPPTALMSYSDCVYAQYLLRNDSGVCDEFTAAFVAMANAIGFEAYDMGGTLHGGGHAWALIRLGDGYYVFDPQAEQVNIKNNQVRYVNFALESAASAYKPAEGRFAKQLEYRKVTAKDIQRYKDSEARRMDAVLEEAIACGRRNGVEYYPGLVASYNRFDVSLEDAMEPIAWVLGGGFTSFGADPPTLFALDFQYVSYGLYDLYIYWG